jgi:hypothetical protein
MPTALLRDPAVIRGPRTRLAHTRVEAKGAHQLLRLLGASPLADRGHDGERHNHVDPWDCHQAFDALVPALNGQGPLDDLEVIAEPIELAQMPFDGKAFVLRQDLVKKPCPSARPAQIGVRAGGDQWLCRIDWMMFFKRDRCRTI